MKLYTKSFCPWCISARHWLRKHDYDFLEINVSKDHEAFVEMERLSGQTLAPTLVTDDGLVLADFGVPELKAFFAENAS